MTPNNKCYLCASTEFNNRPGSVRNRADLDILECASCGLVFLSSFDHIKKGFYENSGMQSEELSDLQTGLKETAWDNERRFQYLKAILPNRSLLDFGCGAGGFLLKTRELTTMAHGVEPEKRFGAHYINHALPVFLNLSGIPNGLREEGYDIITLFHVLEHIPHPKSCLTNLSKLLADNGQIIIEVPNADDALLTLYQCEAFQNYTYWDCHLFLYTAKTLRMLFDQVNLRVNYIKQIQRYPLSNHLYWLATGISYGHKKWHFLDSPGVHAAYEKQLAAIGKCDTIMASVRNG